MARTREEYEEIVSHPGKFEGEQPYAPYFWDSVLDGMVDTSIETPDGVVDFFTVQQEDIDMFPELEGRDEVAFLHTEQGFFAEVDPEEARADEISPDDEQEGYE